MKNLAHPEQEFFQIDIQFGKQKLAKALGFGKKQIYINVAAADPEAELAGHARRRRIKTETG